MDTDATEPAVRFDRAIAGAVRIRAERDAVMECCCAADSLTVVREALDTSEPDSPVRTMRLLGLLEALPSSGGKVASRRWLGELGLDESAALADVTPAAWDLLTTAHPGAVS